MTTLGLELSHYPMLSHVPKFTPGRLEFGLEVGERGQFEYRGPTSSTTGVKVSELHRHQPIMSNSTLIVQELPGQAEMHHHLELFVEWQNSSILVLPGHIIDHIMDAYPPIEEDLETRAVLWSVLSLTYKMFCINQLSYDERAFNSEAALGEAKKLVTSLAFRQPSVEVVRSACILACREYSCGHENSAWVFHGKHDHYVKH